MKPPSGMPERWVDAAPKRPQISQALLDFIAEHPECAKATLLWGPTISLEATERSWRSFTRLLSPEPDLREAMLVGAIQHRLLSVDFDDLKASSPALLDELVELVRGA